MKTIFTILAACVALSCQYCGQKSINTGCHAKPSAIKCGVAELAPVKYIGMMKTQTNAGQDVYQSSGAQGQGFNGGFQRPSIMSCPSPRPCTTEYTPPKTCPPTRTCPKRIVCPMRFRPYPTVTVPVDFDCPPEVNPVDSFRPIPSTCSVLADTCQTEATYCGCQ